MSISTANVMPACRCPHCFHEFDQGHVSLPMNPGLMFYCPSCERVIHVVRMEAALVVHFATEDR